MELEIKAPWIDGKVRCQNGYVYIDKPYWNAEKQHASHKREYIGTYDGTRFIPNKKYHQLEAEYQKSNTSSKTGPSPVDVCVRQLNILVRQSRLSGFIRATVPVIGSHQKCYAAKGSLHE